MYDFGLSCVARLCVGNEEGLDCARSAIFGILAIVFFVNIKRRG